MRQYERQWLVASNWWLEKTKVERRNTFGIATKDGDLPSTYGGRVLDPPLLFMTAHEAN